jgi:hypothetical protein
MKPLLNRIYVSIQHRPWTVDIISGIQIFSLGLFFLIDPLAIIARPAFSFLNHLKPSALSWVMMSCGTLQIVSALLNVLWWRWTMAFLVMWHWCSFVCGVWVADRNASAVVLMACAALANALILCRLY